MWDSTSFEQLLANNDEASSICHSMRMLNHPAVVCELFLQLSTTSNPHQGARRWNAARPGIRAAPASTVMLLLCSCGCTCMLHNCRKPTPGHG